MTEERTVAYAISQEEQGFQRPNFGTAQALECMTVQNYQTRSHTSLREICFNSLGSIGQDCGEALRQAFLQCFTKHTDPLIAPQKTGISINTANGTGPCDIIRVIPRTNYAYHLTGWLLTNQGHQLRRSHSILYVSTRGLAMVTPLKNASLHAIYKCAFKEQISPRSRRLSQYQELSSSHF